MAEPHRTDNHRTALDLHGDKIVGGHPSNRQAEQNPSTGRPEEVRGRRIQLSRKKGWRKPEGAVVVSRPGRYGNPFEVTKGAASWYVYEPHSRQQFDELGSLTTRAEAQEFAVSLYAAWLKGDVFAAELESRRQWILDNLGALTGKDLCCWCADGTACHADVLIVLAAAIGNGR